jgi:hypothetical protein
LPVGDVAAETLDENLTPGSDRDWFEKQQKRKIEMEKIEAVFELNGLSSPRSADDKKVKTLTVQKIFGTTSRTEIEKMDHTELNFRKQELEELFETLKNSDNVLESIENFRKVDAA